MRAHCKVLNGLAQRGGLPVRVDRREIATEAIKLGLNRDNELALAHVRRCIRIDRGHSRPLRFATRLVGKAFAFEPFPFGVFALKGNTFTFNLLAFHLLADEAFSFDTLTLGLFTNLLVLKFVGEPLALKHRNA